MMSDEIAIVASSLRLGFICALIHMLRSQIGNSRRCSSGALKFRALWSHLLCIRGSLLQRERHCKLCCIGRTRTL